MAATALQLVMSLHICNWKFVKLPIVWQRNGHLSERMEKEMLDSKPIFSKVGIMISNNQLMIKVQGVGLAAFADLDTQSVRWSLQHHDQADCYSGGQK